MPKRPFFIRLEQAECSRLTFFMNRMVLKGNHRARLRAKAVYLSHNFRRVEQIAQELNRSTRSVYAWLRAYRAKGLDGIAEPARRSKLTAEQVRKILEVGQYRAAVRSKKYLPTWSFQKTADWVRQQWQINISAERIRQIVNKAFSPEGREQ